MQAHLYGVEQPHVNEISFKTACTRPSCGIAKKSGHIIESQFYFGQYLMLHTLTNAGRKKIQIVTNFVFPLVCAILKLFATKHLVILAVLQEGGSACCEIRKVARTKTCLSWNDMKTNKEPSTSALGKLMKSCMQQKIFFARNSCD